MPTWASADRTVQRGCEPRAINPSKERSESEDDSSSLAILAQNEIFSIRTEPAPCRSEPSSRQNWNVCYVSLRYCRRRISSRLSGSQRIVKIPLPERQ